jgi:isovaleryl-CoA dehydrogenase
VVASTTAALPVQQTTLAAPLAATISHTFALGPTELLQPFVDSSTIMLASVRRAVTRVPAITLRLTGGSASVPALRLSSTTAGGGAGGDLFNPTEEHAMLRETVRKFTETEVEPQAIEFNRTETFNRPLFKQCGDLGLLGITVPTQYGGSGMNAVAAAIVHEELSYSDPAFCLAYLAHSMLFVNNLTWNGNEEQKHKFLPPACSGASLGGMGMSEPGVGTDVLSMRTTAQKRSDGSYVINGSKMWITNGAASETETGDVFLIYARSSDKANDISLFLVEKGMPGFSLGSKIKDKLGMRVSGLC